MSNKNWGNPLDIPRFSTMLRKEMEDLKRTIGKDLDLEKLSPWLVDQMTLKELCGTYYFETEHPSLKLQENAFFFQLFFYGKVGLFYDRKVDKFIIANPSEIKVNKYGEIDKISFNKSTMVFNFSGNQNYPNGGELIHLSGKGLEDFELLLLDLNSMFYYMKYGWFSHDLVRIFNYYKNCAKVKSKGFFLFSNTTQDELIKGIDNDLASDEKAYIELKNPQIQGDMYGDPSKLMQKHFTIQEFTAGEDKNISMEDVIKFAKFGKDLLGMNASPSQKAERMITSEMEESVINTKLMEKVEEKNIKLFCENVLSKFGVKLEIKKTIDKIQEEQQVKNSQFTKADNEIEGGSSE